MNRQIRRSISIMTANVIYFIIAFLLFIMETKSLVPIFASGILCMEAFVSTLNNIERIRENWGIKK